MGEGPLEILQVRADRQTLMVRIPPFWSKMVGLKKGDYLVARPACCGGVVLSKFESEVPSGEDVGDDSGGGGGRQRVPDAVGGQ